MSGTKDLRIPTKEFAIRIMKLYRSVPPSEECRMPRTRKAIASLGYVRGGQLPVGVSHSLEGGVRHAKIGMVLEEADETVFWLELLSRAVSSARKDWEICSTQQAS